MSSQKRKNDDDINESPSKKFKDEDVIEINGVGLQWHSIKEALQSHISPADLEFVATPLPRTRTLQNQVFNPYLLCPDKGFWMAQFLDGKCALPCTCDSGCLLAVGGNDKCIFKDHKITNTKQQTASMTTNKSTQATQGSMMPFD